MIQTLDLRGRRPSSAELLALVPRNPGTSASVGPVVAELIADVRERGAEALLDQAERLDGVRPPHLRVPAEQIAEALDRLDPAIRSALEEAIARVRRASAAQIPPPRTTELDDGATVTQRWQPVARAGLYVPGGKAVYPSSVVMNAVPAQAAGVASIALVSPPQKAFGGSVHPTILAAAALLGIDEVYAVGGAGAVAALAYGVDSIGLDPVSIITGPGNVWVTTAKRQVLGQVGIDSEAGPTEILVIADDSADPRLVAADLVSQAEHDEAASAVLVTDSAELAAAVEREVAAQAAATHHAERVAIALDGPQSALVIVDDLELACAFSDAYGPEHLELHTADPVATAERIHDAGAIFLGPTTPVSLGDYLAGSNHVLPTLGQARFSSGLGAYTFLRPQQLISYDRGALERVAPHIRALSDAEALPAHGDAVDARFA
ncbi:histidinol dehydrogenase [Rathayibacter sp. AY1G1]|uniref:histidinol dehydrogenase n=1 Tax=unclassified Rathayibacter TaxID=2609250 RepID=UPI000CE9088C|nr:MULTISPECIES: histidinol dehydrogenase [unclassified Rathayibacter]PPF29105.1 histidinol dehydrogenase [Rathayibacter sp. AY1F2]PPG54738.1 histidinol dehydrogenase [Rathayibacter sp. AY1E9]PPG58122.1 histidinol dehydrogenase [Rathayibacter sp. AY2B7]PPG59459.1 histidinol dehydrogenase [Rathayibacter sp. AY1C5]PPH01197.1 histidinol dehydrogenase [Rathayibacter sp. AY1F6]